MVDPNKIKFPITLKEFTRLQREEMHRPPTAGEKEFFSTVVELANLAYESAADGDSETAIEIMRGINEFASQFPECYHMFALFRGWAFKAILEGAKAPQ